MQKVARFSFRATLWFRERFRIYESSVIDFCEIYYNLVSSWQISLFFIKEQIVVVLKCFVYISFLRDGDRVWLLNYGAV